MSFSLVHQVTHYNQSPSAAQPKPRHTTKPSKIRDEEFGLHEHPPCPNCNTNPHSSVCLDSDWTTPLRTRRIAMGLGEMDAEDAFRGKGEVSRKRREPRRLPARGSFGGLCVLRQVTGTNGETPTLVGVSFCLAVPAGCLQPIPIRASTTPRRHLHHPIIAGTRDFVT